MSKRAKLLLLVLAACVGSFVGIDLISTQIRKEILSQRVLKKVDGLVLVPPKGVTELKWAVYVYWTHNLHQAAMPQANASISMLVELDSKLDMLLKDEPTLESIGELWNYYTDLSDSGRHYRQRYESMRNQILSEVDEHGDSYFDAGSYREFTTAVRTNK